jgi:hypothetical protein
MNAMVERRAPANAEQRALRELQELIAALDRRLPHVERAGENEIVRDAEALRAKALARIADIEKRDRDA